MAYTLKSLRRSEVIFRRKLHCTPINKAIKYVPHVDEEVEKNIVQKNMSIHRHSGAYRSMTSILPERLITSIKEVLSGNETIIKTTLADGQKLVRYLCSRHTPTSNRDIYKKRNEIREELITKCNKDVDAMTESERDKHETFLDNKTEALLHSRIYNWKAIDYTSYVGKQYVLCRMSGEFAALNRIFTEIVAKDSNYKPVTLFDFGSGVGTVMWAAKKFWGDSLKEVFCVDSSADMNDFSKLLLQDGKQNDAPIEGLYYRQFLPASSNIKYNLVVSSYSLLELPSMESRCETLLKLWSKVEDFLIIVEMGTVAGFKVVSEARSIILDFESQQSDSSGVYVFSPCPHEFECPRLKFTPCTFKVPYYRLPIGRTSNVENEYFSYVVLKRGKRPDNDEQWPRAVRATLRKNRHSICRLCTREGKLIHLMITKGKHGTYV